MLTVNRQKSMENGADLWPANKPESFIQIDSITFGLHGRACPKYPQQVHNINTSDEKTTQGKCEG